MNFFAYGDENGLAQALPRLVTDIDKRERLVVNARRLIERQYAASVMASEYANLYAELTDDSARRDAASRS